MVNPVPGRYDHLFVTDMATINEDLDNEGPAIGQVRPATISDPYGLMRAADVEGSKVHMAFSWIGSTADRVHWVDPHVHDYDEVLMWMGSDPADPKDLGATLSMTIEGEEHLVTTTGSVYIPAGTRHCPLDFVEVHRPFTFIALSLQGAYGSVEQG